MTNEKAKTYFELITEDKEKVNAEMKKLEAKQAALQVESDILATRTELNKAISAYEAAKRQEPFSASRVLDAQNTVEVLEDGLEALIELKEELFPE